MRARSIKPGFFTNEDLAECTLAARLCFAGLWLLADREGRLEDRPKRIKGELFAFDSIEVEPLLAELAEHRFIVRYRAEGHRFIQVATFHEHQRPHYSERSSIIPPPPSSDSFPESGGHHEQRFPENLRKKEGMKRGSPRSDCPTLRLSDSPTVVPSPDGEGLSPAEAGDPEPAANEAEKPEVRAVGARPKPNGNGQAIPDCPHTKLLELWRQVLPEMPQHKPALWTGTRADHLRSRWREAAHEHHWASEADGLAYFDKLFHWLRGSPFLMGRAPPQPGRRPFELELAWLVTPEPWAKVHEGKYHQ